MKRDVKNNARLVEWHTLLLNTMFFMPVMVPYFSAVIGLNYRDYMITQALFVGTIIAADVPTGWVADIWTRRRTLIVATAIYAAGELLLLVARGFWMGALAQIMLGIAVSLLSGAKMALLYDSMVEAGQTEIYRRKQGFVHALGLYSTGAAALAGGFLYEWNHYLPMALSAMMALAATASMFFVAEPARHREAVRKHPLADMMETMRYALHGHREVAGLIMLSAALFAVTRAMWWCQQPYYESLGFPVSWFGIITAVHFTLAGLAGHISHRLDGRSTVTQALMVCLGVEFAACLICGLFPGPYVVPLLLTGGMIFGLGWPRVQADINARVDSSRRATILSTANFMISVLSIPLAPLVGQMQERHGIAASLLALAGVVAAGGVAALLLRGRWRRMAALFSL